MDRSLLSVRNAAFAVAAIAYSAIFVIVSPVFLLSTRDRPVATSYVSGILVLLKWICGLTYDVRGSDRVPSRSVLIAPAPQTRWDASVIPVLLGKPVQFVDMIAPRADGHTSGQVGELLKFYEHGQACVPVAHNAVLNWPNGPWLAHPRRITVEILEPIPAGLDDEGFSSALFTRLEGAMKRVLRTPQRPALMPNLSPAARRLTAAIEAASKAERG